MSMGVEPAIFRQKDRLLQIFDAALARPELIGD
jgi:hypothetical protein